MGKEFACSGQQPANRTRYQLDLEPEGWQIGQPAARLPRILEKLAQADHATGTVWLQGADLT